MICFARFAAKGRHSRCCAQRGLMECLARGLADDAKSSSSVKIHHIGVEDVNKKKKKPPQASWDRVVPWERSSMYTPTMIDDNFIKDEILRFAPMAPRPLSMKEWLDMLQPDRIAKFLHEEVLVRFAERIRWIEEIPQWDDIPELLKVHTLHVASFRDLRLVKRKPTLDKFTEVVKQVVKSFDNVQHDLARGMHRLHRERGDDYGSLFADKWLDNVLLNCIGTQSLMSQYLACVTLEAQGRAHGKVFSAGIIDKDCDVAQICRDAGDKVLEICEEHMGRAPGIRVETFSERAEPRISHIPGFLNFILTEVLKNCCRATCELVKSDRELQKRPINIIVCADEHNVAIRISDRAKGIPFEVGSQVWSYLYSTANKDIDYGESATPLAGYGVGLPLSRLYARYLGGSLSLVSLPGYGTSVDLFLTRINAEQVELVPDEDNDSVENRVPALGRIV